MRVFPRQRLASCWNEFHSLGADDYLDEVTLPSFSSADEMQQVRR
jgi:hypothetical protein